MRTMVGWEECDPDESVVPRQKPWGPPGKQRSATYTVLLVEDDSVTCKLVADGLKSCRYDVVQAENGRVALDILDSEVGRKIDIILTDNIMPEVGGIELTSKLTGQKGHPPIVVMSADFHPDTIVKALAAGASDFLCKPLRKESLLALERHACSIQGKPASRQISGKSAVNLEAKASAQPHHGSLEVFRGSAFQPLKSRKRKAEAEDCPGPKRPRLPLQADKDAHSSLFPAGPQPQSNRQQNSLDRDGDQVHPREQQSLQLAPNLQQVAGTMRNASWPPKPPAVMPDSRRPSEPHQNPVMSRQALFAGLNQHIGPELSLDIKPLLRVDKAPNPAQKQRGPPEAQERVSAPGNSNGMQALRHSQQMSAFTPVSPRFQPILRYDEQRPQVFQQEVRDVAAPQHAGIQQHHILASLPMIAGLNLPPLIAPQPVFYQALRAFQEASVPPQKPVSSAAANRKAALERFRAKRTQRSFEKKVRYTSRQRLAENRPRLKGQFVKAPSQSGELTEATPSTEMNSENSSEAQL